MYQGKGWTQPPWLRGDVVIASQTDNAYLDTRGTIDLSDADVRRRIRLTQANSRTTVVWNPWHEEAAGLRDLGEGEWKQFVCVGASNILDAAINLAPGQQHRMTVVLSVETLYSGSCYVCPTPVNRQLFRSLPETSYAEPTVFSRRAHASETTS
jgi:hypothetical protein